MGDAVDFDCAVDPGVVVFAQESIAPHDKPFEEAIFADRKLHVLRGAGAEVAAGPIGVGDDVLMEPDDLFSPLYNERGLAGRFFFAG